MATLVTHAALPLIVSRAVGLDPREARRVTLAAAVVSCLPDLDTLSFLFDVQARDPWGHRGAMHSLAFGLLLGAGAMLFLPRRPRVWAFLLAAGASHGLLDFFTHGDLGVALLAPFTARRFLFPWGPIAVSPLGVNELFSRFGALVLLNEALVVLLPAWLLVRRPGRLLVALWLVAIATLGFALPGFLQPLPRPLEAYRAAEPEQRPLKWLPADDLPDGGPVTRFEELQALGLFDRDLRPRQTPWSSSFFPSWYGGEAGRWQDSRAQLIVRTLYGVTPPTESELRDAGEDLRLRLSPLEKYDLAVGAYGLPATQKTLKNTHNGSPRYWHGLCNGVASAAMNQPEPFRTVDVVNPDGVRVRFLPNDVKALLAESYFWMSDVTGLKMLCSYVGLDSSKVCSMNAGAAVIALLNRLGLAHASFLVDVHPTMQAQLYAVAEGRVSIARGPYAYDGPQTLPAHVARLVDVELSLVLSSTTLSYAPANRPTSDPTRYEKVGLVPVRFAWPATLALGDDGAILGGRWTGSPPDGPDTFLFMSGGPELVDGGALAFNPYVRWADIQRLAAASVDESAAAPSVSFGQ